MERRFDAARGLITGGAALLLVSLFLPWYGGDSAWTIFETLDLVLAGAALLAGATALERLPDADGRRGAIAVGVAAFVVLTQLLNAPPAGQHASRDAGLWLAVLAVALQVGGTVLSRAQIAVTVDVRGRAEPATPAAGSTPPPAPKTPDRHAEPQRESLLGFGEPPPEPDAGAPTQATESFPAIAPDEAPRTQAKTR